MLRRAKQAPGSRQQQAGQAGGEQGSSMQHNQPQHTLS